MPSCRRVPVRRCASWAWRARRAPRSRSRRSAGVAWRAAAPARPAWRSPERLAAQLAQRQAEPPSASAPRSAARAREPNGPRPSPARRVSARGRRWRHGRCGGLGRRVLRLDRLRRFDGSDRSGWSGSPRARPASARCRRLGRRALAHVEPREGLAEQVLDVLAGARARRGGGRAAGAGGDDAAVTGSGRGRRLGGGLALELGQQVAEDLARSQRLESTVGAAPAGSAPRQASAAEEAEPGSR